MTASRLGSRARASLRFAISALFLVTAAGKLLDIPGFAAVLETYRAFPEWALIPTAILVPLAEIGLAAWLLSGMRLTAAASASAGLHAAYGGWAAMTLARGVSVPNCGCFGVFLARPLSWSTVAEDGAMIAASLALAALARPSP